jgi:hypothetical protein
MRYGFLVLAFFAALTIAASARGAADCGPDPGPPQPVRMTTCDIGTVLGGLRRLLHSLRYRSCLQIGRAIDAPKDAVAREFAQAEALLLDRQLERHLKSCMASK